MGAASILSAVDEGLAGIVDADTGYKIINFSPRFVVTEYTELRYLTGYEATNTLVDVRFIITDKGIRYDILSPADKICAHILLPKGKPCSALFINDKKAEFKITEIGSSKYVDATAESDGKVSFEIIF